MFFLNKNFTPSFASVSCRIRYVWQTWCISALASLGCPVVGSKSCYKILFIISSKLLATALSLGISEKAMAGSSFKYVPFKLDHIAGKSDSNGDCFISKQLQPSGLSNVSRSCSNNKLKSFLNCSDCK